MTAGQVVYVATAGYFTVASKGDSTHATLTNLGYTGNASPTTSITTGQAISPAGVLGATGATGPSGTGGAVTSVTAGSGLTGGTITTTGTIAIGTAGVTNAMLANPSATVTAGSGLTGGGTLTLGSSVSLAVDSASANTANKIVTRDASGNFAAGTITAGGFSGPLTGNVTGAVTGNASTATALAANGTNCSAGSYPLGVDANGNAESCTAAATGTVTSVGLSLPSSIFATGSNVTSSGNVSATLNTQSANTVFAGPGSGSAAAPTFRALGTVDVSPALYAGTSTGSANAHTIGLTPTPASIATGTQVNFLPGFANTGAATLAVTGVSGTPSITKNGTAALAGGELSTTAMARVIYDGTRWQLLNPQTPVPYYWFTNTQNSFATTGTEYIGPFGALNVPNATEGSALQLTVPTACTARNLRVVLSAGVGTGITMTFTLMKGAATTTLVATTSANGSTATDTTHTVALAAGDVIDIQATKSGTVTARTVSALSLECR